MFTEYPHPHHILHPYHGWLTPALVALHEADCPCGHDLPALVGDRLGAAGDFAHTCECRVPCPSKSAHPEKGHLHRVETDASTGMTGYTRMSVEEIAEHARVIQQQHDEVDAQRKARQDRIDKLKAGVDPALLALLAEFGI